MENHPVVSFKEPNSEKHSSDDSTSEVFPSSRLLSEADLRSIAKVKINKRARVMGSPNGVESAPQPQQIRTLSKETRKAMEQANIKVFQLLSMKGKVLKKLENNNKKYQDLKLIEEKNTQLIGVTRHLEETIICLYGDKELLVQKIKELEEKIKGEDPQRKSELTAEVNRMDMKIKEEEKQKETLLKELNKIKSKIDNIVKSNNKKIVERDSLKQEKETLQEQIESVGKEIKQIEEDYGKIINELQNELKDKKEEWELQLSNRNKDITEVEKEKEELLIKKDELQTEIKKLNMKIKESLTEKTIVRNKVNELTMIKEDIEKLKYDTDKQLDLCIEKVANIYSEHISNTGIIEEQYREFELVKKELEIERHQKEIQDEAENATLDFKNNIKRYLEKEHVCVLENFCKIICMLSLFEKDIIGQCPDSQHNSGYCCCNNKPFRNAQLECKLKYNEKKNKELLESIRLLEETNMAKEKDIHKLQSQNNKSSQEYHKMVGLVENIGQIQSEKEANILQNMKNKNSYTHKNERMKYSCDKLEEHIAKKEEILIKCKNETNRIAKDYINVKEKIVNIQQKLEEEEDIGTTYREQMKELTSRKSLFDEKLIELEEVEKRKEELQKENTDLKSSICELQANNKETQDRLEVLHRVISDQKKKLHIMNCK